MLNKRVTKRRHLIYYLSVIDTDTEKPLGFLVDITTRGIMLMSESPIEADKKYHLKLLLKTDLSKREYLNFDAECKWCKQSINSDFYDAGLELIDVDPDDFKEIEETIEALGFND
jgi:hypothetical protein